MSRKQPTRTRPLFLSIIIPAYNEAERLPDSLRAIQRFLRRQGWEDTTEVLVMDDGSVDGTVGVVAKLIRAWPRLAVISLPHRGKGAALREGALQAQGEFIFLCDADLSMAIDDLPKFLPPDCDEGDILIGSREAPGARRFGEPEYRHVMGRVFNLLVQVLVMRGIDDTQCGFKRLTREAAHTLFAEQELDGLSFDVELLALARLRGYTTVEVPIDWYHRHSSRVRPLRDTLLMMRDIWLVRQRLRRLVAVPRQHDTEEYDAPAAPLEPAPATIRYEHLD